MTQLLTPPAEALVYRDEYLYVCLASWPLTRGHTIVAWNTPVEDIHLLSRSEFEHLMTVVDVVRDALLEELKIEKVYLLYMDEVKHVHWHLVPRYDEKGFNMLAHAPKETSDFSLSSVISSKVKEKMKNL